MARVGRDRRMVPAVAVTSGYFPVLGLETWRGRFFSAADDTAACPATRVVVSHDFWQRELGGRESVRRGADGQRNAARSHRRRAPGFRGLIVGDRFDIAFPLCRQAEERRDVFDLVVMGRLKDGWTGGRTTEHLRGLSAGIQTATQLTGYTEFTHNQYPQLQARSRAVADRTQRAAGELRHVAVAAAGDHRPGAAHRLRQPRQPAPRPRLRTRA